MGRPYCLASALALMLLAACLAPLPAAADYPDRIIRMIVPQAPGSATDVLARILANDLGPAIGQSIVIENRPGGAFIIGLDLTAKAAPDGYTICFAPIGALAISPHMVKKLPYDLDHDFQAITQVSSGQMMLAVTPTLPVNSVAELIAYAKAHPGELVHASSGNGSPGHVGGELFKLMAGLQINHVPYRGGSMAMTDLISGHVHVMIESLSSITPFAKSGELRALAVTGAKRTGAFPDLPTIAEAGVPGYAAETWTTLIGPAGLARPVLDRLNEATNRVLRAPAVIARYAELGYEAPGGTPEQATELIRTETIKWGDVVRRTGAKLD